MTTTLDAATADRALKSKLAAMWALGDYPGVAREVIPTLGPELVAACGVTAGQRVLDIAAGSGNAAIPAALTGADVVASDLTPELLTAGRVWAAERGADVTWEVADAEALPYLDGEFDVVLSCVGVMFAPHHREAADELVRVCRPGGTIGVLSWTPAGFIGQMLVTMRPYAAPPAPGSQPPPLWGTEEHVRDLLGDRVEGLTAVTRLLRVDLFPTPEAFREFFKTHYGPTIATYRYIAHDPDKVAALDRDLADLARRFDTGSESGATTMDWEYTVITATRR